MWHPQRLHKTIYVFFGIPLSVEKGDYTQDKNSRGRVASDNQQVKDSADGCSGVPPLHTRFHS